VSWTTIAPALIDVIGKLAVNPKRGNSPKFGAEWEEGKRSAMHTQQAQAVTLKITNLRDVGIPRVQFAETAGKPPGQNVQPSVLTDVIFTLNIRVEMPTREDDHWAFATIQRIRSGLWMPSTQAAFLAANLGLVRVLPTVKASARYDDRIHSIATMDVEFSTVMTDEDPVFVGWIEKIELTSHVTANEELDVPPNFTDVLIPGPAPEPISPIELWILDNSPYPSSPTTTLNVAELWGYTSEQLRTPNYDGPPARLVRLPLGAGRGHGFTVLTTGHLVVTTSEDHTNNGRESWFLVSPGVNGDLTPEQCPRIRCEQLFAGTLAQNHGARHAISWGDQIIIGSNLWLKPVPFEAWEMSDGELAALPGWAYNGNGSVSGIGDYDSARRPGTDQLVIQGHDRVWALNLALPTVNLASSLSHSGVTVPGGDGLDWIMLGDNIGRPAGEGWQGFIAFDSLGGVWKQRGHIPDLAYWSASTIAALPKLGNQPGANPPPDKILTCPIFDAMDLDVESVFAGLDIDHEGGIWTVSYSYDGLTNGGNFKPAKAYYFSPEAVAAGGSQMPSRIIHVPTTSQPYCVRLDPRFRLYER
jgi:hypothetical protein